MTYFGFLLRFVFIPILIFLAIALWDELRGRQVRGFRNGRAVWTAIGIHVLLAVAYTTPWDNYLVATGVWYYNPDLVTGLVIGYVPLDVHINNKYTEQADPVSDKNRDVPDPDAQGPEETDSGAQQDRYQ